MSSTTDSVLSFMQEKWGNWFKVLDVNRDGVLSKQDSRDCIEDFENYYRNRVDEKTFTDMKEGLRQFWEDLIFRKIAHKHTISREEFVASLTQEFQTDPKGLRDVTRHTMTAICQGCDVDNNGYLSYDEFAIIFKAFGTVDESLIRKTYQHYQPSDKGVELTGFIETWIDLAVGENKKQESPTVKGYLSQI